jgi:hypothetical protein
MAAILSKVEVAGAPAEVFRYVTDPSASTSDSKAWRGGAWRRKRP